MLDRLVQKKLKETADALGADGWSWVEVSLDADYEHLRAFRRLQPTDVSLPEADEQKLSALGERYDALVAELEDSENPQASAELDRIEAEMIEIRSRKSVWTEGDKAHSGVAILFSGMLFSELKCISRRGGATCA